MKKSMKNLKKILSRKNTIDEKFDENLTEKPLKNTIDEKVPEKLAENLDEKPKEETTND